MSQYVSRRVLALFGLSRILHAGARDLDALTGFLLAGCDAWAYGKALPAHARKLPGLPSIDEKMGSEKTGLYDVVIVEPAQIAQADIERLLIPGAVARRGLALRNPGSDRQSWELRLFAAGWRRHPAAIQIQEYQTLDPLQLGELAFFEPVPEAARTIEGAEAPDDMLLTPGSRGDFLIGRYAFASGYIRSGDTALVCGTEAGSGAAVLAGLSLAAKIIGYEPIPERASYAEAAYARPGLSYQSGDPLRLDGIEDSSIGCLIAFDLPKSDAELTRYLESCRRALRSDGRLIAGLWIDADAQASQKHLRETLMRLFIPEKGFALEEVSVPGAVAAADRKPWQILITSCNPTERRTPVEKTPRRAAADVPYQNPAFADALAASGGRPVVDFASGYDNPWIYRSLVQIGDRISDRSSLTWLAQKIAAESRPDSADRAAALTVLGYQLLEARDAVAAQAFVGSLTAFFEASARSLHPHVIRWRISTAYIAGRLYELMGEQQSALEWLERASMIDWSPFSPILATKTVAASFHAGLLCLSARNPDRARAFFRRGVEESLRAARGDPADIVGGLDSPIPFGLVELSEVVDMGSQCALALANLHLWTDNPGLFWSKIDIKRFGLMTWSTDMSQENQKLRAENEGLRRALAAAAAKMAAKGGG